MPSPSRTSTKNLLKTVFTTPHAGCVCGCSTPKHSDVYQPKQKGPKPKPSHQNHSIPCYSSSSCEKYNSNYSVPSSAMETNDLISSSFSFSNIDVASRYCYSVSESEADLPRISNMTMLSLSPNPKIMDSVAVVKDSNDPYQDFRHSMLQMIVQKEIYSQDDLQELLHCFLELNSPSNHDVIAHAFMEIWNQVISERIVLQKPNATCSSSSWRNPS